MKKYIVILLVGLCYCEINIYDIKCMGMKVAECHSEVTDTTINQKLFIKLDYRVESYSFMRILFSVTNHYTTIIDPNNYSIIFYSKKTSQPNIINQEIKASYINKKVRYGNTNYIIDEKEKNIFSLLYLLSINKIENFNRIILDREGKKYHCEINSKDDEYIIDINENSAKDLGVIENTDIFTWALFLPNTKKNIKINLKNNKIEFCKFKKGLFSFTADRVNKKAPIN